MPDAAGQGFSKRRQLGARSRTAILDAALQLMAESGYEGASVARISKASGLPTSSIYWHFGSKAGILAAVMERGADAFFATAGEPVAGLDAAPEPVEVLQARFQQARRAVEAHPEFLRLLFLLILADPGDESVVTILGRVNTRGVDLLREQIEEAFRPLGVPQAVRIADQLTIVALTMFNGAFVTVQTNPEVALADLIDAMADVTALLADRVSARAESDH